MVKLTEKESEVLKYLVKGYTNKQIADAMFVSIHIVKAHLINIFRKLEAQNRTHAVYLAGILKSKNELEDA